jgi:hypothetical protein
MRRVVSGPRIPAASRIGLNTMPLYESVVHVEKVRGTHRRATLPTGQTIDFGVHGPIAAHFRLDAEPLPLPVDYIVAATAG